MVLIADPRDMDGLLGAIETYKATVFPGVPNLYAAINHYPAVLAGKYDLSSVKACISGSATLPMKVKREFEALTHGHLVEAMAFQRHQLQRTVILCWARTGKARLACRCRV